MIIATTFGLLLFGFLVVASLVTAIDKVYPVREWIVHYVNEERFKNAVRAYIPHMSQKDREIIGYLLAKKPKAIYRRPGWRLRH